MGELRQVDQAAVERRTGLCNSVSAGYGIDLGQKRELFWNSREPYTALPLEPGVGPANFFGHFFGCAQPMVRARSKNRKKADREQG